jgi:sulfate transport system permease protein
MKKPGDPRAVRIGLIALTSLFFIVFVFLPLGVVFAEALRKGIDVYLAAFTEPAAQSAIELTLLVAAVVVPCNTVFGLFAAWAITRYRFKGKTLLISLLDLPFAVSPVVAGLIFVLLLGSRSPIGAFLVDHGIKIIFATPGIIIATIFITFPLVARELIPLMQSLGQDSEEAAVTLGANGWQTFRRVTLPSIAWGLLFGMVLCNARAIGETQLMCPRAGSISSTPTIVTVRSSPRSPAIATVAPKKTWSVPSPSRRASGSTTSATSSRLMRKRMRRSISRRRFLP